MGPPQKNGLIIEWGGGCLGLSSLGFGPISGSDPSNRWYWQWAYAHDLEDLHFPVLRFLLYRRVGELRFSEHAAKTSGQKNTHLRTGASPPIQRSTADPRDQCSAHADSAIVKGSTSCIFLGFHLGGTVIGVINSVRRSGYARARITLRVFL